MTGSGLDVQTTRDLTEIGQETWDALSAGCPFSSYQWYRYGELAMSPRQPLYISVLQHGRPLARASFWLVPDEPLPFESLAQPLRGALQAFLRARPLLICRSPLADAGGLILPPPPLREPVLEAILSAARAYAREVNASFIVFDYLDGEQSEMTDWPTPLLTYHLADAGTCLPIAWNSFEAYLRSLSRSARKDYRRQANQAARLGLCLTTSARVDDPEEALPLIRAVEQRHGSLPKPWARAMLENMAAAPSSWVSARVDGRLVGCGLLLADGDVQLATLLGLDYSVPYVYFQVVYQAIRTAIEQGARLLRAGSGAYALKQRLGFQLENNTALRFAGQGQILSWAGRLAAG